MTTKTLTYGTRQLVAEFDAGGRVRSLRPLAKAPAVSPDLELLRTQATRLGIFVDRRWGLKRLQAEIEAKRKP